MHTHTKDLSVFLTMFGESESLEVELMVFVFILFYRSLADENLPRLEVAKAESHHLV